MKNNFCVWYITEEIVNYISYLAYDYIIIEEIIDCERSLYHFEHGSWLGSKQSEEKKYWVKVFEYYDKPTKYIIF